MQGSDHLTVTWKVAEGTLQHIDVREEGKENAFSLGHCLWIGNEVHLHGTVHFLFYPRDPVLARVLASV